jgi:poly(3-hydroxybutyrate) depolymerase
MMYRAFELQSRLFEPVRDAARMAVAAFGPSLEASEARFGRELLATWSLVANAGFSHARPDYGITSVMVGNREAEVTEVPVHRTPFGTLLNFRKDVAVNQPKVLLVAPLSGHFATLLRNTARRCCRTTTSSSPTGTTPATFPGPRGASASTNMSST